MGKAEGRTVLVTGGNIGIGRATVSGLAQRGARVYIASRSRAMGEAAVAEIRAATGNDAVFFLPPVPRGRTHGTPQRSRNGRCAGTTANLWVPITYGTSRYS